MTYKILNTRLVDNILYTLVEYTFDKTVVEVEIAHFNTLSKAEIEENILNRASSELEKIEVVSRLNELLPSIEINQIKNINI